MSEPKPFKPESDAPTLPSDVIDALPGKFLVFDGPDGSGKSTLLNCVGGIDSPDSGEIRVGDADLSGLDETGLCQLRREKVSTIFQFFLE